MTESSVIAAAITAIAAHNLKDLTVCNTYLAELEAVSILIAALSDSDIDGYDEATVTAAFKLVRTALGVLITKLIADHKVMYKNTA